MDYITEEKYSFDQNDTLTDHVSLNDRFAVPWNKFQALDNKAGSCKPIESQEDYFRFLFLGQNVLESTLHHKLQKPFKEANIVLSLTS